MAMFLIDTNVMLAASAISELSNVATRAMPREIELRESVYEWLVQFDQSDDHMVLDDAGLPSGNGWMHRKSSIASGTSTRGSTRC